MIMCVITAKAFEELVSKAIKPFDYLLNESLLQHDTNDSDGKQAVLQAYVPLHCPYGESNTTRGYVTVFGDAIVARQQYGI